MIVLDTNVVSHLMARDPVVAEWLELQPPLDLVTTSITLAEIRFGIARLSEGQRKESLSRAADQVFESMADRILAFDTPAADTYGPLLAARLSQGRPMSHEDAQIASIARVRHGSLATRNVKDFEGCGVTLVNPFA